MVSEQFATHLSVLIWSLILWLNVGLGVMFFGADVVKMRLGQLLDAITPSFTERIFPRRNGE